MTKNIKYLGMVEVTQEDIDKGSITGHTCPVALALKRKFYGDVSYHTDSSELWVPKPKRESEFRVKYATLKMPRSVKRFINKFDGYLTNPRRDTVKPFKFKAEVA